MNYRLYTVLGALCLLALPVTPTGHKPLTRRQARHYVEHVIDTLIIPPIHGDVYEQELEDFIQETASALGPLGYTSDQVYKETLKAVGHYIESQTARYAYTELKKHHTCSSITESHVVRAVTQGLYEEVRRTLAGPKLLAVGVLSPYVGSSLRAKVATAVQREVDQATTKLIRSGQNKELKGRVS